jgi:hypothetical protein
MRRHAAGEHHEQRDTGKGVRWMVQCSRQEQPRQPGEVLPLPAGAEMSVTRASVARSRDASSSPRWSSRGAAGPGILSI